MSSQRAWRRKAGSRRRCEAGGTRSRQEDTAIRRRQVRPEAPEKRPRRNNEIRAGKVRLISDSGEQMGIVWLREALDSAFEAGLDLIEVAPDADPPVCRIMDWGRYRFEQKQRERDQRRKQRVLEVKGLRMRPTTDDHDFGVVRRKAEQFLRQGHKVRVEVRFRGREITHRDLGEGILSKLVEALSDVCELESSAALEGRRMFIIIAPQPQVVGTSMSAEDERLAATDTLHDEELADELAEELPVEAGASPADAAAGDDHEGEPDDDAAGEDREDEPDDDAADDDHEDEPDDAD